MGKLMKRQRKPLNAREEMIARLMVQGQTAKEASKSAGYKSTTPAYSERVRDRIQDILKDNGLGLDVIAVKLREGLEATKIVGNSNDFIEVPDYITRHKYIDTLLRLQDQYPTDKHMVELDTVEARLKRIWGG